MTKNCLLFCPSLYRENSTKQYYSSKLAPELVTEAVHTNAPIFHHLSASLKQHGEQIDYAVMIASHEVLFDLMNTELGEMTTADYLRELFKQFEKEVGVALPVSCVTIEVPGSEITETAEMQNLVSAALENLGTIKEKMNIWIDFTSGLRSHAVAVMFISRFLETKGHVVKNVLYANMRRKSSKDKPNTIESCNAVYDLFDIYQRLTFPKKNHATVAGTTKSPKELAAAAVDELDKEFSNLPNKLRNTSNYQNNAIRSLRQRAHTLLQQYQDDAYVQEKANEVLTSLPDSDDALASVEFLLSQGDVATATKNIRELAFRYMLAEGILTDGFSIHDSSNMISRSEKIENDVVAGFGYYYSTFLPFMDNFFDLCLAQSSETPTNLWKKCMTTILRNSLEKGRLDYRTFAISDYTRDQLKIVCGDELQLLGKQLFHDIENIIMNTSDTSKSYADLLRRLEIHRKTLSQYEQVFVRVGFPLPCYDSKRHNFCFPWYRIHLVRETQCLLRMLEKIQQGTTLDQNESVRFGDYVSKNHSYSDAIENCKKHLDKLISIRFSFEQPEVQYRKWNYTGKNKEFHDFLLLFLPLFDAVRNARNDDSHILGRLTESEKEERTRVCVKTLRQFAANVKQEVSR